jgi:hypothetical protein
MTAPFGMSAVADSAFLTTLFIMVWDVWRVIVER